jgi:single-strand DNA-binding protein
MSFNFATLTGNLTRDPESRTVQSGNTVCNFDLAVNEKKGGKESVLYVKVAAWGKTGELCQQYLKKGQRCTVGGRIGKEEYQKRDGSNGFSLTLEASIVDFGPKQESRGDEPQQPREERQPQPRQEQSSGIEYRQDMEPQGDGEQSDLPF